MAVGADAGQPQPVVGLIGWIGTHDGGNGGGNGDKHNQEKSDHRDPVTAEGPPRLTPQGTLVDASTQSGRGRIGKDTS